MDICKNCDLGLKREDCSDYEYKECLNGGRKITEWDKFNESKELCKKLGCKQWSIDNCYPELINVLCRRKKRLLRELNIYEVDLEDNIISYDKIKGCVNR